MCSAGMNPPKVHSQLTSYSDNRLLALAHPVGAFCQDGEPLLHGIISGLNGKIAPCQFDQGGRQPAISVLCDRTGHPLGSELYSPGQRPFSSSIVSAPTC